MNSKGMKSIFKRRGNESGSVEAVETSLNEIVEKEELRKKSEGEIVSALNNLVLSK